VLLLPTPAVYALRVKEPARYHVHTVQRSSGPYGKTIWRVTFLRVGSRRETLDVTLHSAVFATLDLEAIFTAEDLMRLREAGGF
jgi:hypothetical protein